MNDNTLTDLCRRVAAAGWKPRAGMAVRDPETGERWVRLGEMWADESSPARWVRAVESWPVSLRRALAAGPDPDCPVTVLGLLADLPEHTMPRLPMLDGTEFWCCCRTRGSDRDLNAAPTRAESILRAWLRVHEAKR